MNNLEYIKKYLPDDKFEEGKKMLDKGISPQYIVGNVNFYGNEIKVDKRVLIPRFETELLVEKSINYIKNIFNVGIRVLDMCCGSGCIGITLKKEIDCDVISCDISNEALELARENANINKVDIDFINSNIFSNIDEKFDVIISNPPYIAYGEEIEEIVKNNEPHLALYAGDDGIYYYDKILSECSLYLNDKFFIAFEIGCTQGVKIKELVYEYLGDVNVSIEKDYSDKDRFVFIWN